MRIGRPLRCRKRYQNLTNRSALTRCMQMRIKKKNTHSSRIRWELRITIQSSPNLNTFRKKQRGFFTRCIRVNFQNYYITKFAMGFPRFISIIYIFTNLYTYIIYKPDTIPWEEIKLYIFDKKKWIVTHIITPVGSLAVTKGETAIWRKVTGIDRWD